jgi:hypothetical protein
MRTFHTGGIFSGEAKETILSPFTGKIWYDLKNGGKKIFTKYKEKAFLTYENKKVIIYQNNVSKSIMYFPKNSIVFTKPGRTIFDKQIIAELPKYKKSKFDLNINFIEVKSKFPGQIYFENEKSEINNKIFWILSANIFTYTTFLVRLLNKCYVKNVNVFFSKEQALIFKESNKMIQKSLLINISLRNMLSISKTRFKRMKKRFIHIRRVLKEDTIILTSKSSSERVVNTLNFDLKLGELFKADDILSTFKNFYPSQVIQKTKHFVLIRKISSPYLEKDSLLDFSVSPFVVKNAILSYSPYRKQKAEDIVQGLPKVEHLFEARKKKNSNGLYENLHGMLARNFESFQNKCTNEVAVRKSIAIIQNYLLSGIQDIYESQGVDISDKHVEVIIKQMTSNVMVTTSGDSSLMIGDIHDLNLIESMNRNFVNKIKYEPVINRNNKFSLSSQSFISAASFQETTKILTRSALKEK